MVPTPSPRGASPRPRWESLKHGHVETSLYGNTQSSAERASALSTFVRFYRKSASVNDNKKKKIGWHPGKKPPKKTQTLADNFLGCHVFLWEKSQLFQAGNKNNSSVQLLWAAGNSQSKGRGGYTTKPLPQPVLTGFLRGTRNPSTLQRAF